jgi:3D-(3,5/4)-trihydroxycyclohexane-1,2-dione acylhydrolase (decyclizing)
MGPSLALRHFRMDGEIMSETSERMTVAQAVVKYLSVQYSERDGQRRRVIPAMWGIFGHGNAVGIGQALAERPDLMRLIQAKNEQSMVHSAIGYAKSQLRLSTFACTASIGPGATNLITGAATATVNRLPVLLLPSDTFATRRPGHVLQQLETPYLDVSVNDCLRPVSTFFDRISRPEQLIESLPEAIRVLLDPADTGAVTICLPQDVQGEVFDFPDSLFDERVWIVGRRPAAADEISAAVDAIRSSTRPLVIAGGGVRYSHAESHLINFCETFGVPVAETSAAVGSLVTEINLGGIGVNGTDAANLAARDADLVIHIGTRLTDFTTSSHSLFENPDVRFVGINVKGADASKMSAWSVVADAQLAISEISTRLSGAQWVPDSTWKELNLERRRAWRLRVETEETVSNDDRITQGGVLTTINTYVDDGDWVIAAAGGPPGDLLKSWLPVKGVGTHIEFGYSCMGHEIPAGLGIRYAQPDTSRIFVVIGDGTFLMANSELITALQEAWQITVIILVNGGFQSIHGLQSNAIGYGFGNEFRFRDRESGQLDGKYIHVDYEQICRGLGSEVWSAKTGGDFRRALDASSASKGASVIVCEVSASRVLPSEATFWDLGVPQSSNDERTKVAVQYHQELGLKQRHYLSRDVSTTSKSNKEKHSD